MTLQVRPRPPQTRATLKTRNNVSQMSPEAVARFRNAVATIMKRPDNRGFQFLAGWHGVPLGICEHHNDYFLPWHRGYLYFFELALQDVDPEVTLPWWDWMNEAGIPAAFTRARIDGKQNVLRSSKIQPMGVPSQPNWPKQTVRNPGGVPPPSALPPPLGSYYDWMMEPTTYDEFEQRCWRLHDNIHVWVGGTMGDPNWAAFDPLFWAHHAQVDRLWRIWQYHHPGALPSADVLETSLTFAKPPSFKVKEVLDVQRLGYEYSALTATARGTN